MRNSFEELSPPKDLIDNLSLSDWSQAKEYFEKNAKAVKFDKYSDKAKGEKRVNCSFIKVENKIYAIKNGKQCLGEGESAKVKIIQNEERHNYAVRIEGRSCRGLSSTEVKAMVAIGEFYGEAERQGYNKRFKNLGISPSKLYTVTNLYLGNSLQEIEVKKLTHEEKLLFAIKATEAVKALHDKKVIHRDIKPDNFIVIKINDLFFMKCIDFGYALCLEQANHILTSFKGAPFYGAPEIVTLAYNTRGEPYRIIRRKEPAVYSLGSDIYALGIMFKFDFELDLGAYYQERLLNFFIGKRPSAEELIQFLTAELEMKQNPVSDIFEEKPNKVYTPAKDKEESQKRVNVLNTSTDADEVPEREREEEIPLFRRVWSYCALM